MKQSPKYPWDVLVVDLNSDWYSIPFETRLEFWHNVEKDFGWMPSGNPDNTNTWHLCCRYAIGTGITPISQAVVDHVLGDYDCYDLARDVTSEKFYENPYAKQKYAVATDGLTEGRFFQWLRDLFVIQNKDSLTRIPMLANLEWVSEGRVWDQFRSSANEWMEWSMRQQHNWSECVYEENVKYAKTTPIRAESYINEWLNWPYLRKECAKWIEYFARDNEKGYTYSIGRLIFFQKIRELWSGR